MVRARTLLVVTAWLASSSVARAQNGANEAQSLFDDGRRLMEAHDFVAACPKLAESNRLDPSLGTVLWLGGCYEKLGQNARAWSTFESAAKMAHEKGDDRESVARDHMTKLEPLLIRLTIDVPRAARVATLEVRRDGVIVDAASWGVPILVEPGPHVVSAMTSSKRWEQSVDALAGQSFSVTVPALIEERRVVQPSPERRGSGWAIAGWTIAGVGGAAGVALGTGFGLDAKSKLDASNGPPHNCVKTVCADSGGVDLRNEALASATGSTIAFVAGGVLLATGITIVLLSPSHKTARIAFAGTTVMLGGDF